jgi:hypothetical protein
MKQVSHLTTFFEERRKAKSAEMKIPASVVSEGKLGHFGGPHSVHGSQDQWEKSCVDWKVDICLLF